MRTGLSLNGRWKFYPAFDEISANQQWMDPGFDPKNPDVKTAVSGRDVGWIAPGFDDAGWLDIPVPASWNAAVEDLWSYEGHGWYRRTVVVPMAWAGRRVEFSCEGANYLTALYVNGRFVGEHEGGFTPFAIPVTDFLRYGEENTIAVSVDSTPKPNRVPGGQYDWWNEGGLYRDVSLRVTDRVWIDDVTVVTDVVGARAAVTIDVVVRGDGVAPTGRAVAVTLFDPAGRAVALPAGPHALAAAGDRAEARIEFDVPDALVWAPETPHLYDLRLILVDAATNAPGDAWQHRIGLRTIKVEGAKLLLNGAPLLVKGVNTYEDYPESRRTHDEAALGRDLDLLKWIGGNAFRSHIPGHRRRYEVSDERGVLQLVELPLYQWGRPLVQTDDAGALEPAKRQLAELIRALKNHPCVFMWSVSNENLVKPKPNATPHDVELATMTAEGNKELVRLAQRLDPTRPVVEVSNCWPGDPVHEVTDLPCVNVYVGAPTPNVPGIAEMVRRMREKFVALRAEIPDKPILAGEWGSWCVRGVMTDYFPGEIYQAEKIRHLWEGMLTEPNFCGGFIWCFADYDVHRRFLWVHEYRCAYGLFDYHRRPKVAAHTVRKMWTGQR